MYLYFVSAGFEKQVMTLLMEQARLGEASPCNSMETRTKDDNDD
jgi:hypothetical protein